MRREITVDPNRIDPEKEFEKRLRNFGLEAALQLNPLGFEVVSVSYTDMPDPRVGGRIPGMTLAVHPDKTPRFLHTVDLDRRLGIVYGYGLPEIATKNGFSVRSYIDLAIVPKLDAPLAGDFKNPGPPDYGETKTVKLEKLISDGTLSKTGDIYKYCQEAGLDEVAMTKGHIVSPDPFSVSLYAEAFKLGLLKNILEIGGGVSPVALLASRFGVSVTIIDNSADVIQRLLKKFPQKDFPLIKPVLADAADFLEDNQEVFDAVNLGLPYELLPDMLYKFGGKIRKHSTLITVQSGMPGLGQMEHDIMMGRDYLNLYIDYMPKMSLSSYYPYVSEGMTSYQYGIIAGVDKGKMERLLKALGAAGRFASPIYKRVTL